jgi:hypothetical protein
MAYFDPSVKGDFSYLHDLAGQRGQRATMRRATKEIIASKFYFPPKPRMLPQRWRGMCVVAEYPPEAILPLAGDHYVDFEVGGDRYHVNMEGTRYRVFSVSLSCYKCGLTGTVLRLEYDRNPSGEIEAHFNLYAPQNGRWTLMTQDHVIPRAKGGADNDGNLRTMCSPCNTKKGDKLLANLG